MKIMNSCQTTLSVLALAAACATGCLAGEDSADPADDSDLTGQTSQAISGRYCVDQSYASIWRQSDDQLFLGCYVQSLQANDTIGRDHPVNVHNDCGTYVFVKDLWGTGSFVMRKDALRPC